MKKNTSVNVSKKTLHATVTRKKNTLNNVSTGEIKEDIADILHRYLALHTSTWRTQHNVPPSLGEFNFKPSLTVPDQALTVRQILDRYASGRTITDVKTPVYNGDTMVPDARAMHKMDLADREEIFNQYTQQLDEINEQLRKLKEEQNTLEVTTLKAQLKELQDKLATTAGAAAQTPLPKDE